jgi:hypothetical protein
MAFWLQSVANDCIIWDLGAVLGKKMAVWPCFMRFLMVLKAYLRVYTVIRRLEWASDL